MLSDNLEDTLKKFLKLMEDQQKFNQLTKEFLAELLARVAVLEIDMSKDKNVN
jgi:hypothetical protein